MKHDTEIKTAKVRGQNRQQEEGPNSSPVTAKRKVDVQTNAVVNSQAHQLETAGQGQKHSSRQTKAFHQGHLRLGSIYLNAWG